MEDLVYIWFGSPFKPADEFRLLRTKVKVFTHITTMAN